MAQRIRRLTSNQKIGGSNPSVVDILFYTKEISYKGCQYKGQHLATEQATDTIDRTHNRMAQRIRRLTSNQKIGGSNPSVVDMLFYTKESSYKECQYKGQHLANEQATDTIDRTHDRMAQWIRRLTSNQKIGGSNPSVVDILFYTKEISYKGCQYKGQHLATEQATDTIDRTHNRMAQRIRRLTSNQKIGGSNPSVVDMLFYTKESSYKECQYKGQHLANEQATDTIDRTHDRMAQWIRRLTSNQKIGGSNPLVDFFLQRKLLRNRVYTRDNTWQLNKYQIQLIDRMHGRMDQRIRRLTSNQKIGGSNPSVVDILFYTKEISYKGCQYKGQHLATEQATDTIDRTHGRMAQRIRRLTSNQKIGGSNILIDFFLQRKLLRNRVYTRDNTWQLNK